MLALLAALLLTMSACGDADDPGAADPSASEDGDGADADRAPSDADTDADRAPADADADDVAESDDASSVTSPDPGTGAEAASADPGELGPIASMLAHVPDAGENRQLLTINDYEGALETAELEWPPSGDEEAAADVFLTLSVFAEPPILVSPSIFGRQAFPLDPWRTEVGFTILDVERDASTGEAPGTLSIIHTTRSAGEIEHALQADPVWGSELVEVGEGEGAYFAWGDDPLASDPDPERITAPRPLGRGGAMAVLDDGTVIRSPDPSVVVRSLDATNGGTRSLLDDESYLAVANALDAAGAYTAHLTSENVVVDPLFLLGPFDGPPPSAAEIEERLGELTTVPPYVALGIGNKVDLGADPQGVLVLVFAAISPESAAETVAAIEEIVVNGTSIVTGGPWSELLTVASTSVDGSLAIVELRTANPRIGIQSFQQRHTLFASL